MGRTFTQHLAHLESMRDLRPGERVRVTISGKTGRIVRRVPAARSWRVAWDAPVFGRTSSLVIAANLERIPDDFPAA
jgi:hypothetical protein